MRMAYFPLIHHTLVEIKPIPLGKALTYIGANCSSQVFVSLKNPGRPHVIHPCKNYAIVLFYMNEGFSV